MQLLVRVIFTFLFVCLFLEEKRISSVKEGFAIGDELMFVQV